jgi:RNA polymerase sigma-70 factor (ECF subfamily)
MDERGRAVEQLYRAEYGRFLHMLATLTGSYESAHDAVQETFARAYSHRREWRGESSLSTWVWRIAVRTAPRMRSDVAQVDLNGSFDPAPVEPERDPELSAALRALPPKRRLIVFLRYFADLSYAQIAEVCGINEGTVAATLAQAREQLEDALTEEVR